MATSPTPFDPLFNLSLRSVLLLQNELTKPKPFLSKLIKYLNTHELDEIYNERWSHMTVKEWWEYNATLILLILEAQDPQES